MRTRQGSKRQREGGVDNEHVAEEVGSSDPEGGDKPEEGENSRSIAITQTPNSKQQKALKRKAPNTSAKKRQKSVPEPSLNEAEDAESEDEGPEEVSLVAAKAEAEEEAAMKQVERSKARSKSKRRRQVDKAEEPVHETGNVTAVSQRQTMGDEDELPAEVIEALQMQRVQHPALQPAAQPEARNTRDQALLHAEAVLEAEERESERQAGPVTVSILSPEPKFAPLVAATEYASQRLYGSRHQRSIQMLYPVAGSRKKGPCYRQAHGTIEQELSNALWQRKGSCRVQHRAGAQKGEQG